MPARMSRRSSFTNPLTNKLFRVHSSPHLVFILHRTTRAALPAPVFYPSEVSHTVLQPYCDPSSSGHLLAYRSPVPTAPRTPITHLWLRRSRVRAPSVTLPHCA